MTRARLFPIFASTCLAILALLAGCKGNAPGVGSQGTASPASSPAHADAKAGMVVATVNGEKITLGELDTALKPQLNELARQRAEQEARIREQGINQLVARRLVEAEAKKRSLTTDALIKAEVSDKVPAPQDSELRSVYDQNKSKLNGKSFDEVKPGIANYVRNQKLGAALEAYIDHLRTAGAVTVTLPAPDMPRVEVAADGPARGSAGAPVTVVIFSDFQCPYCSKAKPIIDQVAAAYGDKVRIVFRDFPLPIHPLAEKAAEAGHCADQQGSFWAMHDWMFSHQEKIDVAGLKAGAREIKLDGAKFDQCLDNGQTAAKVQEDMKAAKEAGVQATPTFFINGQMLSGAGSFDDFKKVIDSELQGKS
jgi:protein-disulfide isomerase